MKSLALAWTRESTTLPVDSWRLQFVGQEEFCESSLRNYIATEWQIYDLWFTSLFTERERKITITYLRIITCRYACCTVCLLRHLQLFPGASVTAFFAISERRLFGLNLAPKSLAACFISIKKCSQSSVIYFARGYVVLPDALSSFSLCGHSTSYPQRCLASTTHLKTVSWHLKLVSYADRLLKKDERLLALYR